MNNFLSRLIGDKQHWRRMEARAGALPRDYRVVYGELKDYLWRFTSGDGMDIVAVLEDVLAMFEAGAAEGKPVRQVTGDDVAAFGDDRLRERPASLPEDHRDSYQDRWRTSLNRAVSEKLAE